MCVLAGSSLLSAPPDRPVEQACLSYLLPAGLTRSLSRLPHVQVTLQGCGPRRACCFIADFKTMIFFFFLSFKLSEWQITKAQKKGVFFL